MAPPTLCAFVKDTALSGGSGFILGAIFPMKITALSGGGVFGSLFAIQVLTNRIASYYETKFSLSPERVERLEIVLSVVATTALLVSFVALGILTGLQAAGVFLLIQLLRRMKYFDLFNNETREMTVVDDHAAGSARSTLTQGLFPHVPLLTKEELDKRKKEFEETLSKHWLEQEKGTNVKNLLEIKPLTLAHIDQALDLMKELVTMSPTCKFINSGYKAIAKAAHQIGKKGKAQEIARLITDEAIRKACLDELETPVSVA